MTPEQLNKLPAYARHAFASLQNRNNALENLNKTLSGVTKTKVRIDPYKVDFSAPQCLPDHTSIGFETTNGMITVRLRSDGTLDVSGVSPISVHPTASNCCWIAVNKD